jgi:hypothetical protein
MYSLLLPLTLIATLGTNTQVKATGPHRPPVPSVVEGRVVDEAGTGIKDVGLWLVDTTRFSGYVDPNGCGTYHPQETVWTGPDGRFRAELPFTPTEVSVSQAPEDFEGPSDPQLVISGKEIGVTLKRIHWIFYEGQVVDEQGAPLAQVRIDPHARTDDAGRFQIKLHPRSPPETFRFRKIGFKPIVVPAGELAKVVLRERRTLVKVKLLDTKTKKPVEELYRISAYRGDELLSYCSAGTVTLTHEPTDGECTLDADPGKVELRVEGGPIRKIKVTAAPQEVTLEVKPRAR